MESKLLGDISTISNMQMIPLKMVESKEELKSLLMSIQEESEKAGLKLNIQKMKIMASFMSNNWGKSGNSDIFYFLGLQKNCGW